MSATSIKSRLDWLERAAGTDERAEYARRVREGMEILASDGEAHRLALEFTDYMASMPDRGCDGLEFVRTDPTARRLSEAMERRVDEVRRERGRA